jgi:membrane peptidoglycan carboxypeptidase
MKLHTRLSLLLTLIFALVGCDTLKRPCVRVGATQAEIHQGMAIGMGINLHRDKDQDPNLRVSAGFERGVCNRIKYVSVDKRKISDHAVSGILCLNSRGVAWIVQEFPKTEGKVYYRSVDGRYWAVVTYGNEIFIYTETLFRKTMSEIDAETQKSKAGTSSLRAYPYNQPIQQITDKTVEDARKTLKPKGITIVVAEPSTGKILAMSDWAEWPLFKNTGDYTPATPNPLTGKPTPNLWTTSIMFEPGSIFKPVVAVAALEEGVITPETKIDCENGLFKYGGKTIKDHTPVGDAKYDEILAKSSNIGAAKMALMLQDEDFYECVRKFGFGEKSGISLPWEIRGLVNPPSKWLALTKAHMGMGQSVAVTPIQLTMAYCALANEGNLMRPVIGAEKPKVVRRVCSKSTANRVKNALKETASTDGTAPLARVKGMTAGGKAGTAQAISPKGEYLPNQYWTMFVGFFPVDNPKYVITVVVDEADLPPAKNFGRLVAAPIFAEVASRIERTRHLEPV